jgi:hypothetical protein
MRPHNTAPTGRWRTSGDGPGRGSAVTRRTPARGGAVRRRPVRALALSAVTRSLLLAVLGGLALAAPAAAPTTSTFATWPSKHDARRVAVREAAATCRALAWCTGYDVVPARRCRRASHKTVYCAIAFITAERQRCGGVVGVTRTRRGRLARVMAVPQNCSADPDGNHALTID